MNAGSAINPVTAGLILCIVVPLWTAALHAWIYFLRPSDKTHGWFALAASGGGISGLPIALIYTAQSPEEAALYRSMAFAGGIVFLWGLASFTELFLHTSLRLTKRVAIPILALSALLLFPSGSAFEQDHLYRYIPGFNIQYVDVQPALLCFLFSLFMLAISIRIAWKYLQYALNHPPARVLFVGTTILYAVASANDFLTMMGIWNTPYLGATTITIPLAAITAELSRRFVVSAEKAHHNAIALQHAAEERALALRKKDLQLAQGESLSTLGTIAAGLAHEINNPIAFISANLNHLEEIIHEPDTEHEFAEVLSETKEGIQRICNIADGLTNISERGNKKTALVDLESVVRSVLPIAEHKSEQQVRIETHLQPFSYLEGDPNLLGQVVLNLILNAIHAANGDEQGYVFIFLFRRESELHLEVKNSGPEIPANVLPHIFEPFYTTKQSGKGTGLGLAISKQIVEQHGGTIHVQTDPTEGTKISVIFPASVGAPTRGSRGLRSLSR